MNWSNPKKIIILDRRSESNTDSSTLTNFTSGSLVWWAFFGALEIPRITIFSIVCFAKNVLLDETTLEDNIKPSNVYSISMYDPVL